MLGAERPGNVGESEKPWCVRESGKPEGGVEGSYAALRRASVTRWKGSFQVAPNTVDEWWCVYSQRSVMRKRRKYTAHALEKVSFIVCVLGGGFVWLYIFRLFI